jgi:hypothetical protein
MHLLICVGFGLIGYVPNTLYIFFFSLFLTGVGTTRFSSWCDKDSAIVFTTGRLPEVNPPQNWSSYKRSNAAGTNGLTCLPKHGGNNNQLEIINFGHPSDDCPLGLSLASAIARRALWPRGHRAPHLIYLSQKCKIPKTNFYLYMKKEKKVSCSVRDKIKE